MPRQRRPWTRGEKLLLLVPGLFLILILPAFFLRGDGLDRKMRQMAGPGAVDCGTVDSTQAPITSAAMTKLDACAIVAYRAHRAFYGRLDEASYDFDASSGVVVTARGERFELYTENPGSFFLGFLQYTKSRPIPKGFVGSPFRYLLY